MLGIWSLATAFSFEVSSYRVFENKLGIACLALLYIAYVKLVLSESLFPSYSSRQRLRGGGFTTTLPEAQGMVRIPEGYTLRTVPADGNCFYHSLIAAANDGRSTSVWSVESLRI